MKRLRLWERSSMRSIPTLKEFLNDERREVRGTCEIALAKVEWDNSEQGKAETTKPQEENPWVYQSTFASPNCGLCFGRQFRLKIQHRHRPRPSSRSNTEADVSTLLKPSSIRLFPSSSDTEPSLPCVISALRLRSTRSLQPCSRRMKSALYSLKHAVAFVFGQMSDPHSVPALLKFLKTGGREKWYATKRRRLLVELPRTRSCPRCGSRPPETSHTGRSRSAVWGRLTWGRYVRLTSDRTHLY